MAKITCQNGKYYHYSIDPMTHLKLHYSVACTKHLTGLHVSTAAIVRAALAHYSDHLETLLTLEDDDLKRSWLVFQTKEVIRGDKSVPPKLLDKLHEGEFPKLSALLKQHQEGAKERMWKELNNTWFYRRGIKAKAQ